MSDFAVTWYPVPARRVRRRTGDPGLWLSVLAAAGWLFLVAHPLLVGAHSNVSPGHHADHVHAGASPSGGWAWATGVGMWAAMVVATMLPLIASSVRFAALRSPQRHRFDATVHVVAGWAAVWAATAALLWLGTTLLRELAGPTGALVVTFGAALVWQCTRCKRVRVARCHRTLAPPLGRLAARRACRRFGVGLGVDCAGSCWALTAAMAVAGHALLVVVPLAWVSWFERRRPHHDPPVWETVAVVAVTAAAALLTTGVA